MAHAVGCRGFCSRRRICDVLCRNRNIPTIWALPERTGSPTMRISTAYFAGAGTVVAAIVAGVSGGLLMGDVISPKSTKPGTEMSRLERRMAPDPIPASVAASEPVPYLAAPQLTAAVVPAAPAPAPSLPFCADLASAIKTARSNPRCFGARSARRGIRRIARSAHASHRRASRSAPATASATAPPWSCR